MISLITKFWKLASLGNIRLALIQSFDYIRRTIYSKIGLSDFIRSRLLIGGPAFPLHTIYVLTYRKLDRKPGGSDVAVMNEDWDNLILLDSYRADYFSEYSSLEGELSTVISKGTWSLEFIVNNFQGTQYHDTVVVTSNPYYQRYSKLGENTFHKIIYCPKTENIESFDNLRNEAIEASQKFPNKRLIIHFMKPHGPHVGETSDRLRAKFGDIYPGIFPLYKSGVISKHTLEQSYCDTINTIEPKIKELLDELGGKSVVSSDHGENLGERRHGLKQVAHGNPTPECYRVPWLEVDYTERRHIVEDPPVNSTSIEKEVVEQNLRALGYK